MELRKKFLFDIFPGLCETLGNSVDRVGKASSLVVMKGAVTTREPRGACGQSKVKQEATSSMVRVIMRILRRLLEMSNYVHMHVCMHTHTSIRKKI
jgi:hypothetical protein